MAVVIRENLLNTIISSRALKESTEREAKKIVKTAVKDMLEEFDNDPVTEEIKSSESNPDADNNITGTLGGYGNLFSFIGFEAGDNPTDKVREVLKTARMLQKSASRVSKSGRTIVYHYPVSIPNRDAIEKASPIPWERGRSWIFGIEEGISGLGQYLRGVFNTPKPSRSGGGVQVKKTLRGGGFMPMKYMSDILRNFRDRITNP